MIHQNGQDKMTQHCVVKGEDYLTSSSSTMALQLPFNPSSTTSDESSSSSVKSSPQPLRKQVSFNTITTTKLVRSALDFTPKEIRSYWYNGCELRKIRNDVKLVTDWMMSQQSVPARVSKEEEEEHFCTDGLDLPQNMLLRRIYVKNAMTSLLVEQEQQRAEGVSDPDLLSKVYFEKSRPSVIIARTKAIRHANILQEESNATTTVQPTTMKSVETNLISSEVRRPKSLIQRPHNQKLIKSPRRKSIRAIRAFWTRCS